MKTLVIFVISKFVVYFYHNNFEIYILNYLI